MRCMYACERAICHCIGGGKVLSCPKRYRSVESRHVFCTRPRKYSRRDCVRHDDIWTHCEKKKRFNTQNVYYYDILYAYYTPT